MRLTELVEPIEGGGYRCGVCQWRCTLAPGEAGRCLVRVGAEDGIAVLNDGLISAAHVGPIEDHRLWHLLPGTQVLTLGGWGYAFPADQPRGQYANIPDDESKRRRLASIGGFAAWTNGWRRSSTDAWRPIRANDSRRCRLC